MALHAGIDTGGTFTDLVVLDDETGAGRRRASGPRRRRPRRRRSSTASRRPGSSRRPSRSVTLGTTVGTNALLERRGARVLLLDDGGLRGRPGDRPDRQGGPVRPAPRRSRSRSSRGADCIGVRERIGADGTVVTPLTDARARARGGAPRAAARRRRGETSRSPSASSSRSPTRRTSGASRRSSHERFPGVAVSVSHRAAPVWREHERTTTTIVDAYLTPVVRRLAGELEAGLAARGFVGPVSIMKSNGGRMLAAATGDQAVQTVLSGLSGGIVAGRHFGLAAGSRDVVTFDMGGTSADIGLVRDGEIQYVPDFELEFGLPIATPAVDLVTIGAGGGSIAWVDDGGLLRVGPAKRRRRPGPGLLRPRRRRSRPSPTRTSCSAGSTPARSSAAGCSSTRAARSDALAALGARVGLDAVAAAEAVIEIANEGMAGTIRRVAVERGVDPRDFELVAFGGAGPLHAAEIAASLGMAGVIVPPHPGLASAFGTLLADRRVDRRSTHYARSDAVDVDGARRPARRDGGRRARGARRGGLRRRAAGRAVAQHALRGPEPRARGAAPARRARRARSPTRSPRSTRSTTTSTATASRARRSS